MRLKRANAGARVCALVSFVVLSTTALTASPALAIPEGRVYEMVSPPYKGGYSASEIRAVAADGESVAFTSFGEFAGAPGGTKVGDYVARRGVSGWSTAPSMPPASIEPSPFGNVDFSPNLESILAQVQPGPSGGLASHGTENEFVLHSLSTPDTPADWEVAGLDIQGLPHGGFLYADASPDFSDILIEATEVPLLPEAVEANGQNQTYDILTKGVIAPSLRLVGLDNKQQLVNRYCPTEVGSNNEYGPSSHFNEVSDGGEEIFFETGVEKGRCGKSKQLFVRIDGAKTLEISKPMSEVCSEVPCPGAATRALAAFKGASKDGSRVFFTTAQPLVGTDHSNNLYMATIGCPGLESECEAAQREVTSLVQVSHDPTVGQAAEVQGGDTTYSQNAEGGVVRVAQDGSRVYFVARGVLSEGANAEGGIPVKGADNLYVYDSASGGQPVFIADLCSGPGRSGESATLRCPLGLDEKAGSHAINDTELFLNQTPEAQTTADGRFLVFSSYGQLTRDDTDSAKDVYRYDALTGALDRVSIGEAGYDANGNNSAFAATINVGHSGGSVILQYEMDNRAISEDGSRIVFKTAEPLSPNAVNHLTNVYEWHKEPGWSEDKVALVSTGNGDEPVEDVVISPSGRDVFFVTSQGLLAQDTDGAPDVYDARLGGGGFPALPAERQQCSGDACQGPLSNPAPLLVPGSVSQAPGGNFAAPSLSKAKAKKKSSKKTRKRAKTHKKAGTHR